MINFDKFKENILPITLKHEGGFVNDPTDRGGMTYRGVSMRSNPDWDGWELLKKHLPLNRGDIVNDRELCKSVAGLYWQKYFENNRFNELDSLRIALYLFDFAVHGGYSHIKLQKLLDKHFNAGIVKYADNFGSKTTKAVNDAGIKLLPHLINWREGHIDNILAEDPTQKVFEKGWKNRIASFKPVQIIPANKKYIIIGISAIALAIALYFIYKHTKGAKDDN